MSLSTTLVVLMVVIMVAMILIVIFLATREFWCWYLKINIGLSKLDIIIDLLEKDDPITQPETAKAEGQYGPAIQDYKKAVELNPKDAMAYYHRGIAYAAKGQYDLAIQDYSKAIELIPKLSMAYYNRGKAQDAKGHFDLAIQDFIEKLVNVGKSADERIVIDGCTVACAKKIMDEAWTPIVDPDRSRRSFVRTKDGQSRRFILTLARETEASSYQLTLAVRQVIADKKPKPAKV